MLVLAFMCLNNFVFIPHGKHNSMEKAEQANKNERHLIWPMNTNHHLLALIIYKAQAPYKYILSNVVIIKIVTGYLTVINCFQNIIQACTYIVIGFALRQRASQCITKYLSNIIQLWQNANQRISVVIIINIKMHIKIETIVSDRKWQ